MLTTGRWENRWNGVTLGGRLGARIEVVQELAQAGLRGNVGELRRLVDEVANHKNITLHLGAQIQEVDGFVGAIIAAIAMAVVTWLITLVLGLIGIAFS